MADFRISTDYFPWLEKRIGAGDYTTGEQLAEALRSKDSLPLRGPFSDYLCRFLAGKVPKRRGRPKAPKLGTSHNGNAYSSHLEHITRRILSGDYISGSELADVLRREAAGHIPDVLLNYLYKFLTENINTRRGRPPLPRIVKQQRDMIVNGAYRRYMEYLIKRKAREGHAAGWTRLTYPPAEIAARIVARHYYYGLFGEDSWRSVQTISSAYRKRRHLLECSQPRSTPCSGLRPMEIAK